jgi:hypothetical protein
LVLVLVLVFVFLYISSALLVTALTDFVLEGGLVERFN